MKFNHYFHEYIKRDWLDLRDARVEEFALFVNMHQRVIMKPLRGGQGKGIFILTAEELTDAEELLNNYRMYLAEEILVQHETMEKLNTTSVNTVRVLTFQDQVIAAAIRIGGAGSIVDNLHANGVCAHVDLETGIVDAPAVDNVYNRYICHPENGTQLVGFAVPYWKEVKESACKAAKMISNVAYIGWDIAVLENGVALIEGNHDPGHDVVQMIAQIGLYQEIKRMEANNR